MEFKPHMSNDELFEYTKQETEKMNKFRDNIAKQGKKYKDGEITRDELDTTINYAIVMVKMTEFLKNNIICTEL